MPGQGAGLTARIELVPRDLQVRQTILDQGLVHQRAHGPQSLGGLGHTRRGVRRRIHAHHEVRVGGQLEVQGSCGGQRTQPRAHNSNRRRATAHLNCPARACQRLVRHAERANVETEELARLDHELAVARGGDPDGHVRPKDDDVRDAPFAAHGPAQPGSEGNQQPLAPAAQTTHTMRAKVGTREQQPTNKGPTSRRP